MPRYSTKSEFSDDEDRNMTTEDEDMEDVKVSGTQGTMMFSSQAPEMTQDILAPKDSERTRLMNIPEEQREKAVCDLSRLLLFKGLSGESIDRAKCIKEVNFTEARVSAAIFDAANERLKHCFGFELVRIPVWMEKWNGLSKYHKERYYLANAVQDDTGAHSKAMHSVHKETMVENGFLMMVLAFAYCQGTARADGSRWILDKDLYRLLNMVDENLPADPPTVGSSRSKTQHTQTTVTADTPSVDILLAKFVKQDYLLKAKPTMEQLEDVQVEDHSIFYAMGPRAGIEIGRRQVVSFCSEILDEQITPAMLKELEDGED